MSPADLDTGQIALRPGYPVALGMVLVVLSFAVTLGYSHFLLQPIDERALAITENEVPSLQHLANMRVELAHLGKSVRDLAAAGSAPPNSIAPGIEAAWDRIESEFRLYRDLATSSTQARWVQIVVSASSSCEALRIAWSMVTPGVRRCRSSSSPPWSELT